MRHRFALIVAASLFVSAPMAQAQNFSCGIGDRGACLGFGDTVCSSQGKCVGNDALCFDRYQCDYEGFTCKSNVTECVDLNSDLVRKYNTLLQNHDDLVYRFNELLSDHEDLVTKYNDLSSNYEDLTYAAKKVADAKSDLELCIELADDLDAAKACRWY